MRCLVQEVPMPESPERVMQSIAREPGVVLLRSAHFDSPHARYSMLAARPFLVASSRGSCVELTSASGRQETYGNPWRIAGELLRRYEMLQEVDLPFPTGGCFGYWGYDLKHFVEPKLSRRLMDDLDLPDAWLGFYDHLLVIDHRLAKAWIIATGMQLDGTRSETRAREALEFWLGLLESRSPEAPSPLGKIVNPPAMRSSFEREGFLRTVRQIQRYIRHGHIYQANLAQRLTAPSQEHGWDHFQRLLAASPAPFAAYLNAGRFQLASSSPEQFLQLSGNHIRTRPIKGTRPRSTDPDQDARLSYELRTSPKEIAELVMITDLLRNDLGRVCEYGSVRVPELLCLERFPQVQHLVSTVEGSLHPSLTHLEALAACFPGGSITGAPKFRAMEIIEELEPVSRGPYTGCLGYLGFNRESQFNILIRTSICLPDTVHFHAGAGIVADSDPLAEYEETWAKAEGFLAALDHDHVHLHAQSTITSRP